jgi:ABC-type phosphate transport system substrate-binding protein
MSFRSALSACVVLAVVAVCATGSGQQPASTAPPFVVIVNPHNPVTEIDRSFAEDAFLKKVTTWPSGEVIKPVDLVPDSPVRRAFTHSVLERSVEAVKGYWQQRIFSGRDVPPPELESDVDVVGYVLKHEGGVGYVSGATPLGGCHAVGIR